eukprot:SAG31_NODE_25874_length_452_cov_1.028329_1_plen_128_part_10
MQRRKQGAQPPSMDHGNEANGPHRSRKQQSVFIPPSSSFISADVQPEHLDTAVSAVKSSSSTFHQQICDPNASPYTPIPKDFVAMMTAAPRPPGGAAGVPPGTAGTKVGSTTQHASRPNTMQNRPATM